MKASPEQQGRKKGRRSKEEKHRLLSDFAHSGKSQRQFCDENGLQVGTFKIWLKEARQDSPVLPAFTEVILPPHGGFETPDLAIELPNGVKVLIRDTGDLSRLILLIRGVAGC